MQLSPKTQQRLVTGVVIVLVVIFSPGRALRRMLSGSAEPQQVAITDCANIETAYN